MPLEEYRRKRRFNVTPEPAGAAKPRRKGPRLAYVIQKHRATALHYDFRLEWNGVLLSWAVPKGPSLDPAEKRLAMPTEDHPIEYAAFEGIIPAAEYGGGTVMIWDSGTWAPESPDVDAALKKGDLKFTLLGEKLKGSWVLVRTKGWKGSERASWLLIKHRDAFASTEDIAETQPRSVVSQRLLTEIAIDEGGDAAQAATGDPASEVERLVNNPKLLERKRKAKPAVWHSNKTAAENVRPEGDRDRERDRASKVKRTRAKAAATAAPKAAHEPDPKRGRPSTPTMPTMPTMPTTLAPVLPPSKKSPGSFPGSFPGSLPVPVSNPDKVFWPDEGYTKLHLVAFYAGVFPKLKPYVDDRLLSLERCPDGLLGQAFYQKEKPAGMPADTPTKAIKTDRGVTNTVVGGKLETQLALANLGCIAVHVWGSRAQDPTRPDWVCFDLDPDTGLLSDAVNAALKVKAALDALELESFVKTSGGKGLHIFVPIKVGPVTDDVLGFAQGLGTRLAAAYPKELTMEMRIAARKGRVFLDSFRNGYGQTVVTPFCVRRRPGAPVSTPLEWSEVKASLAATDFNLGNFAERLKKPDPWARFFKSRQSLGPALAALKRL